MKRIYSFLIFTAVFVSCDKLKNKVEKNMQIPNYSYKDAKIDEFYYFQKTSGSSEIIPLLKPYDLIKEGSSKEWGLATFEMPNTLGNVISPVIQFNLSKLYIYGYKPFEKDEEDSTFDSLEKWFIINNQKKELIFFDKESDFKAELQKLNLPEEMLNPDEVYEQFKNDPILPWFREDIKKQLKEAKNKK